MSPARDGGGGGSSCLKKLIRPTHIKRRGQAKNIVATAPSFPPKKAKKREELTGACHNFDWLEGQKNGPPLVFVVGRIIFLQKKSELLVFIVLL